MYNNQAFIYFLEVIPGVLVFLQLRVMAEKKGKGKRKCWFYLFIYIFAYADVVQTVNGYAGGINILPRERSIGDESAQTPSIKLSLWLKWLFFAGYIFITLKL